MAGLLQMGYTTNLAVNSVYKTYKKRFSVTMIIDAIIVEEQVGIYVLMNKDIRIMINLLEVNLPKPGNPHCGPTDQRPSDQSTNQLTNCQPTNRPLAEKFKCSRDRAQQC